MRSEETATVYLHRAHKHLVRSRFGKSGKTRLSRVAKRSMAPIYWYVKPILQAVSEVKSRGARVKTAHGVGILAQLTGCIAFTAGFRAGPAPFFDYQLFLREQWARRREYLYNDELTSILSWLNEQVGPVDAADLIDKRRFHDRAARAGLPIIPILAEFERGTTTRKSPSAAFPASDLFSKCANRLNGEGARLWRRQSDGSYGDDDGSRRSLAEIRSLLCRLSREYPLILQPCIANHRELRAVSGEGLSTVRVITLQDSRGNIELALACFRMAVGSSVVDNFAAGGLAAPVDLNSGRLGAAVFRSRPGVFASHPNTRATILGRVLPHWPGVKQLSVAAHKEFGALLAVGWDIAITDDGPVIVEGNPEWGVTVIQLSHQQPLAATMIPDYLAAHLRQLAADRSSQSRRGDEADRNSEPFASGARRAI